MVQGSTVKLCLAVFATRVIDFSSQGFQTRRVLLRQETGNETESDEGSESGRERGGRGASRVDG